MPKTKRQEQRIALVSDLHVGANVGLAMNVDNEIQKKVRHIYEDDIKWFGESPDIVILNGDGTDGEDKKSGDVVTSKMDTQAKHCAEMLLKWNAKKEYVIVSGTPYHTSVGAQELDRSIADKLQVLLHETGQHDVKVIYRRKLKMKINGWFNLECRHKVGNSSIMHGWSTAQERSKMWNVLNAAHKGKVYKRAPSIPHLIVFGHVHRWHQVANVFGTTLCLPCYCALGGEFGDKMCDGHIDLGCMRLIVKATEEEDNPWQLDPSIHLAAVVDRTDYR